MVNVHVHVHGKKKSEVPLPIISGSLWVWSWKNLKVPWPFDAFWLAISGRFRQGAAPLRVGGGCPTWSDKNDPRGEFGELQVFHPSVVWKCGHPAQPNPLRDMLMAVCWKNMDKLKIRITFYGLHGEQISNAISFGWVWSSKKNTPNGSAIGYQWF